MWKKLKWTLALAGASAALVYWGCGLDEATTPNLAGPSELAQSIELRAVPDQLTADGWSSSVIEAVYRDQNGNRTAGKRILFDVGVRGAVTAVGGNFSDVGSLSPLHGVRPTWGGTEAKAESAVTDSEGVARVRYWSPFRTNQVNDIAVTITGRPEGTDYRAALYRQVDIYLRAADRPLFPGGAECDIIVEPSQVAYELDQQIFFTAAQSEGASGFPIARYEWDFGDGSPRVTDRSASHRFEWYGTFTVTLYTTEAQTGAQESCPQEIHVTPFSLPTTTSVVCPTPNPSFVASPLCGGGEINGAGVERTFFDASASTAGGAPGDLGDTIVRYVWFFGVPVTLPSGTVADRVETTDPFTNVLYTMATDANISITLTVENDCGATSANSQSFAVLSGGCP